MLKLSNRFFRNSENENLRILKKIQIFRIFCHELMHFATNCNFEMCPRTSGQWTTEGDVLNSRDKNIEGKPKHRSSGGNSVGVHENIEH